MNHIFLKTSKVGMSKEELLELLKEATAKNAIDIDEKTLKDVYLVACKAYKGKKRYSGEEYVTHPINEAILIKLAERLHNMRTIDFICESKKAIKAKETIEIYMPLARKINNQKLTDELNDLAFKYNV